MKVKAKWHVKDGSGWHNPGEVFETDADLGEAVVVLNGEKEPEPVQEPEPAPVVEPEPEKEPEQEAEPEPEQTDEKPAGETVKPRSSTRRKVSTSK